MSSECHMKDFVRNILGCTCPDNVFEQIEDKPVVSSGSPHTRSIIIGGRLLIYLWKVKEADRLKEHLLAMLEAGKKERDEKGLNRFRAVMAVDIAAQHLEAAAKSYFSQYAGKDDRIHLHVVSAADLKNI